MRRCALKCRCLSFWRKQRKSFCQSCARKRRGCWRRNRTFPGSGIAARGFTSRPFVLFPAGVERLSSAKFRAPIPSKRHEMSCTHLAPLIQNRAPSPRITPNLRSQEAGWQSSVWMYLRLAYEAVASLGARAGYGGTRNGGTRLTWLAWCLLQFRQVILSLCQICLCGSTQFLTTLVAGRMLSQCQCVRTSGRRSGPPRPWAWINLRRIFPVIRYPFWCPLLQSKRIFISIPWLKCHVASVISFKNL